MNRFLDLAEKITTGAAWASGALLLATAFLIALEVTLRKGFAISLGGADEISSYTLAICCGWTMGFALLKKAHVRIDVLYSRLPKPLQVALDLVSLSLFGGVMTLMAYYAFLVVTRSYVKRSLANTPLATPLWIPQGLWFAGLAVFAATIAGILAASLVALLRGESWRAQELAGVSTLQEEIEEEGRGPDP